MHNSRAICKKLHIIRKCAVHNFSKILHNSVLPILNHKQAVIQASNDAGWQCLNTFTNAAKFPILNQHLTKSTHYAFSK